MAIEIREVKSKSDLKKFVRFANILYKENRYYTPVLEFDELNTFDKKKNPSLDHCDFVCYLVYKDNEIVGRICGIINNIANRHWNRQKVRFGWFDFIDDSEVSKALLDAVAAWGKAKGMTELNGPVGFTDFDHQGLLLEGFEYIAPMASLYNYPYYEKHFEKYGLTKEADWIEYQVFVPHTIPEKMARVAQIVQERYKIRIDKVRSIKELKQKYGYSYFDIIDEAYQPLYNFQPLTDKQKRYYSNMYFPLINFDFITIAVNEKDEIVGLGIGMPDISKALKETDGKLFPFGWYKILKALKAKHMECFNLLLIAVKPEYQNKGINALFFYDQIPYFQKYGIRYAETTSILEDNSKNRSNFEYFEVNQHKRRRAYIKPL